MINQAHKNLKSHLTDNHMALEVSIAKGFIKEDGMFDNMLDYVHIDKKGFS